MNVEAIGINPVFLRAQMTDLDKLIEEIKKISAKKKREVGFLEALEEIKDKSVTWKEGDE
jgi:hypothetical protein